MYLHIQRSNTDAIKLDKKVDNKTRAKRSAILRKFSQKMLREHQNKFIKSSPSSTL